MQNFEKYRMNKKRLNILNLNTLKENFEPKLFVPALSAGLIIGILNITYGISFGALLFSGTFSEQLSTGIGFILLGTLIVGSFSALFSSFSCTIAAPQDIPITILSIAAASIAIDMLAQSDHETAFNTFIIFICLSSFITGLVFLIFGLFKIGDLIRFIPYPVIGGFLAGTGILLIKGAISFAIDKPVTASNFYQIFQEEIISKWIFSFIFALLMIVVFKRIKHYLSMPIMLGAGVFVFYIILYISDYSFKDAMNAGWVLSPFSFDNVLNFNISDAYNNFNSMVIIRHLGDFTAIIFLSSISLLLNASGLELVARRDIDLNKELITLGLANMISGLNGSPPGYHTIGSSALGLKMGVRSRLVGIIAALVCGFSLFFGGTLLSYFPKPVITAMLIYLGLSFVVDWIYNSYFKLPKIDYLLIIIILTVVSFFGYVVGIGFGVVTAVIVFVVTYSRINVIKYILSGKDYQSNVDRSIPEQRLLKSKGDQVYILKLQGFIFFWNRK